MKRLKAVTFTTRGADGSLLWHTTWAYEVELIQGALYTSIGPDRPISVWSGVDNVTVRTTSHPPASMVGGISA